MILVRNLLITVFGAVLLLLIVFGFSACSNKSAYVQCYEAMLTDEASLTFGDEANSAFWCRHGILSEADLRFCLDKVGNPDRQHLWILYNLWLHS